jgi:hypothetical protein
MEKQKRIYIPASNARPKEADILHDLAMGRPGGKMKNPKDVGRAKNKAQLKKQMRNMEYHDLDE